MRIVVAICVFALCTLTTLRASAFHAGSMFGKAPGAGGGGGVFYAGAPKDHGWTCRACHTEAPNRARIALDSPELFASFKYAPNKTYTIVANMVGETKGIGSQANFNTLTVQVVNAKGEPIGQLQAPADDFTASGSSTIAGAGQLPNQTQWTFRWTAPAMGVGQARFFIAAVDGNGAGKTSGTLTDPWGDDVFTGQVTVDEDPTASTRGPKTVGSFSWLAFAAIGLGAVRRRRS